MLVYFRGHGDWFINDKDGQPKHLVKAEDRGSYINSPSFIGYKFYRPCDLVDGVFKLTKSDESIYLRTGKLPNDKNGLLLLPCAFQDDQDSAFAKMVDKGILAVEAFERGYFKIATNRYNNLRLRRKPELSEEGRLDYVLDPIKQNQSIINSGIPQMNNDRPVYLNQKHPMFSTEFSIAVEAWQAVLANIPDKPKRGSRKTLIRDWLDSNYPNKKDLSNDARERISVLLNPDCDKSGGAPSSD